MYGGLNTIISRITQNAKQSYPKQSDPKQSDPKQ